MRSILFSTKLIPVEHEALTIEDVASRLGLHYMTVYRYVRTGRLPAEWRDGRWHIRPEDLDLVTRPRAVADRRSTAGADRGTRSLSGAADRMLQRLLCGDSSGAWLIVENALLAGTPQEVYLQVLAPCLRAVGEQWERGEISVADEHRATAVALGLIGRLGPLFARRGRRRPGSVLLAGAEGDVHTIPITMVGDLLRAEGVPVIQLGADVPVETLVAAARSTEPAVVGLSASTALAVANAERAIGALHRHVPGVPVLLGGPAVASEEAARASGADAWAPDASSVVDLVLNLERREKGA